MCYRRFIYNIILTFSLLIGVAMRGEAATTEIVGVVKDSLTQEVLAYTSVFFEKSGNGTAADADGNFSLSTDESGYLTFSMVGYKDKKIYIKADGRRRTLIVELPLDEYDLGEFVVTRRRRQHYKKKNNPAFDLAKLVIEEKDKYSIDNKPYYSCDKYQKITYAWNGFEAGKFGLLKKKFSFLYDHIDTTAKGNSILPLGLREVSSTLYAQRDPKRKRTVIHAKKFDGLDELLPQESVQQSFNEFFQDIDIFQNDIVLVSNHFVSPLSNVAPSFYKYYALDTLEIDGVRCLNLGFTPHTTEAYGFVGSLYIALDSTHALKRARFNLPKDINMNFVQSMFFEQDFDYAEDGTRLLTKDFVSVEFFVPTVPRIYGERLNSYRDYHLEKPRDTFLFDLPNPELDFSEENELPAAVWDTLRHMELSTQEARTQELMKELRHVPIYRFTEGLVKICTNNFIQTKKENSQFDFGPVFSTLSSNDLEGFRIRVGGETTTAFDKHFFLSTYIAYGFKDKRPKGMGSLEYSFNEKKKYHVEYPVHSLKVHCRYDVDKVGDEYFGTSDGNLFTSLLSRVDDRNAIYCRDAGLSYLRESYAGLAFSADYLYKTSYSTFLTNFQRYNHAGELLDLPSYSMSTMRLSLRYAPKEKFYQSRQYRFTLNKEVPIVYLSHTVGLKGLLGSDYTYNRTELSFQKRVWFSYFGYVDFFLRGVKVWNRVPYTLLDVPSVSPSYIVDNEAFNLMDPVEFINDQSVFWNITYYMNGLILNRIPVIRKLQLREVFTFKGIWGSLSDRNNPNGTGDRSGLFAIPGATYVMERKPYMEVGAGIENIIKLFRVDYVWRLNYRDHEGVSKHGIRVGVHFNL